MADVFDKDKRSQIMSHVKNKSTTPEVRLRSILHKAGYRFRINRKDLPGKPDIVLPKYKVIIFVNGCFWHGHSCKRGQRPQTNIQFWNEKIGKNIERDKIVAKRLEDLGWRVLTIWECEIKKKQEDVLISRIRDFLNLKNLGLFDPQETIHIERGK